MDPNNNDHIKKPLRRYEKDFNAEQKPAEPASEQKEEEEAPSRPESFTDITSTAIRQDAIPDIDKARHSKPEEQNTDDPEKNHKNQPPENDKN